MSPLIKAQNAIGAGDFESSRRILNRHLRNNPSDTEALYLLGICEQAAGDPSAANDVYTRILKTNPAHFGAHYNMGLLLSSTGNHVEALAHHDEAIRIQPGQFWAYINRGNAKANLRQYESAIQDYQYALSINPQIPEAHANTGNALKEIGRLEESLAAHDKAIQLRPNYADAWSNKASTLIKLKRPEEALLCAASAIKLASNSAQAWCVQGAALYAIKRHADAVASYERATQLKPDYAEAGLNRGIALSDMRRHQEALDSYDHALKIDPNCAETWSYRGMTLMDMKSHQDALLSYEKALQINPELDQLLGTYLRAKMSVCDWDNLENNMPALIRDIRSGKSAATPLGVMGLSADPALISKVAAMYTARLHPPLLHLGPIVTGPRGSKIRLGYYSADFRAHPVAQLLAELLELHDQSRFEFFAFSVGPTSSDPLRQRIARAFDQFIDVRGKSDKEIAQLSRDMGIDIAVNLGGYTDGHRTDIFAMRAAPIQVSYLGFPGTMGANYIDYLITDKIVCPESSQPFYTEKMAYLPHCFMPHDSTQEISSKVFTRQDFDLPESGFVFCGFNAHQKITPWVFDVWMRLLNQVPDSVLWLSDGNQAVKDNLAKEAAARGVDPARIVFARRLESMAEHLARYRLADLFIDTLPYNAHTTACDALWAGVPVLTCAGESFASRVAASLLHAIGLPELVTNRLAEYEALALELATNPAKLSAVRQKLAANRLSAPLFDTKRLAKDIHQVYTTMFERYLSGMTPDHLHP